MITPIVRRMPERFGSDESPKEIFRDDPERLVVTRIRRLERELANFQNEWCRAETGTPGPFSIGRDCKAQSNIDAVLQGIDI